MLEGGRLIGLEGSSGMTDDEFEADEVSIATRATQKDSPRKILLDVRPLAAMDSSGQDAPEWAPITGGRK
jgi:hypothetical protein